MGKNKKHKQGAVRLIGKGKAFDAQQYRAGVHREATLPSCGQTLTVRVLDLDEIRIIASEHPDAVAQVEQLRKQNPRLDDTRLLAGNADSLAYLNFVRRLVCEASVAPRIVMEPTTAADALCVRDIVGEDLSAILGEIMSSEVVEAAKLLREMEQQGAAPGFGNNVFTRGAPAETEDEEWERKTRENEAIAAAFTSPAMIDYMTGKKQ